MPQVHLYIMAEDSDDDIRRAEEYASRLAADLGLELGGVFYGRPYPPWRTWAGSHIVITRHDTAFATTVDARSWYRYLDRSYGVRVHYADLGQPADQVDYTAWRYRLIAAHTQANLDVKRKYNHKLGGRPVRAGYKVKWMTDWRWGGEFRRVKIWVPDEEHFFIILPSIAFLRDHFRYRQRHWHYRREIEVLPTLLADDEQPRPGWSKWKRLSWEIISDCIERGLAIREGREERPRVAGSKKKRRLWTGRMCKDGYDEWKITNRGRQGMPSRRRKRRGRKASLASSETSTAP